MNRETNNNKESERDEKALKTVPRVILIVLFGALSNTAYRTGTTGGAIVGLIFGIACFGLMFMKKW